MGRRRLGISIPLFLEMFGQGREIRSYKVMEDGLPEDAVLLRSWVDGTTVWFLLEHPTWEGGSIIVPDRTVPEICPIFRSLESDQLLEYEDRGEKRKIAFVRGHVTTDWKSGGSVWTNLILPLEHEVEVLT